MSDVIIINKCAFNNNVDFLVYERDCKGMLKASMSKLSHYMWTLIDRLCKGHAARKCTHRSHGRRSAIDGAESHRQALALVHRPPRNALT